MEKFKSIGLTTRDLQDLGLRRSYFPQLSAVSSTSTNELVQKVLIPFLGLQLAPSIPTAGPVRA